MDISTLGPGRTRDSGEKHLLGDKGIRPYVPIHALLISLSMISCPPLTRTRMACTRLAEVASLETFAHLLKHCGISCAFVRSQGHRFYDHQSSFVLLRSVLECYSLSGSRKRDDYRDRWPSFCFVICETYGSEDE